MSLAGKKVLVCGRGSRGDAQPFVALCVGLQRAGFQVLYLTNPDHEGLCAGAGVPFASCGVPSKDFIHDERILKVCEKNDFLGFVGTIGKFEKQYMKSNCEILYKLLTETFKPDVVVCGTSYWLDTLWIPELLGIPTVCIQLTVKFTPNGSEAPFGMPTMPLSCCNLGLWKIVNNQYAGDLMANSKPALERLTGRKVETFFPNGTAVWNFFGGGDVYRHIPYIIAHEELLNPRQSYTPSHWQYSGALSLPRELQTGKEFGGAKADAIEKFLGTGQEPIYIGWGSIMAISAKYMTCIAVRTLKILGRRGVVLSGWSGLSINDLEGEPDEAELRKFCEADVLFIDSAPHEMLLPRCAVIVHHGGSGTTVASIRSGRPVVITPILYDQFEFADLVTQLGLGKNAGHLPKMKPETLAACIKECLSNDTMKEAAKRAGEKMRINDGAAVGAEIVAKFMREQVMTGEFKRAQEAMADRRKRMNSWGECLVGFAKMCSGRAHFS